VENLLFNARDATFEMRNQQREEARKRVPSGQWLEEKVGSRQWAVDNEENDVTSDQGSTLPPDSPGFSNSPSSHWPLATDEEIREALIAAAAWRGTVVLRTRKEGDKAILEVEDNGIGMTEEVRRRCTETHFSTKRDNALYEGNSTGMGLGLSFVVVILGHHQAALEIQSEPLKGALFRITFPMIKE
jgi:hypothetical protein